MDTGGQKAGVSHHPGLPGALRSSAGPCGGVEARRVWALPRGRVLRAMLRGAYPVVYGKPPEVLDR